MRGLTISRFVRPAVTAGIVILGILLSAVLTFIVAPTEATMGDVQRILYVHVSVAWCGLASCLAMGFCAGMYLGSGRLEWDHWAQAAAEVGWLCTTLTLMTGSAWAHVAWGTWWTWDPRLTSSLVLWAIYAGIVLVRGSIDDPHRRARIGGVIALIGTCDVPLVIMATRWFRGVHPVAPEMDMRMRFVLLASVLIYTALFAHLLRQRRIQLQLAEQVAQLEADAWPRYSVCWGPTEIASKEA
jgi:heme exporter protein C